MDTISSCFRNNYCLLEARWLDLVLCAHVSSVLLLRGFTFPTQRRREQCRSRHCGALGGDGAGGSSQLSLALESSPIDFIFFFFFFLGRLIFSF